MRQFINWFSCWHATLAVVGIYAGTYVVTIIVDRSNRMLKRLRGKTMSWEEVEERLESVRGTLIYMESVTLHPSATPSTGSGGRMPVSEGNR